MRRLRSERGQTSVELMLVLPLLLLLGLFIWQMHLTLNVANDAENAARTASRSGGGADAAKEALEPQYRDNITKCEHGDSDCGIQVTRAARQGVGRRPDPHPGRLRPRARLQGARRGGHAQRTDRGTLRWG